jgi:hypothetical protein
MGRYAKGADEEMYHKNTVSLLTDEAAGSCCT